MPAFYLLIRLFSWHFKQICVLRWPTIILSMSVRQRGQGKPWTWPAMNQNGYIAPDRFSLFMNVDVLTIDCVMRHTALRHIFQFGLSYNGWSRKSSLSVWLWYSRLCGIAIEPGWTRPGWTMKRVYRSPRQVEACCHLFRWDMCDAKGLELT